MAFQQAPKASNSFLQTPLTHHYKSLPLANPKASDNRAFRCPFQLFLRASVTLIKPFFEIYTAQLVPEVSELA
jgi:hypothetical protein